MTSMEAGTSCGALGIRVATTSTGGMTTGAFLGVLCPCTVVVANSHSAAVSTPARDTRSLDMCTEGPAKGVGVVEIMNNS